MKIYTKTGDKGQTSLFGGGRVPKNSLRIETCGEIDELNSAIGIAIAYIQHQPSLEQLKKIQFNLFTLGAEIATNPEKITKLNTLISSSETEILEHWIDELSGQIEPLKYFILPSGGKASAHLHLARTICRRAERSVVNLHLQENLRPEPLQYLNRLSDYLFILARFIAKNDNEKEHFWIP